MTPQEQAWREQRTAVIRKYEETEKRTDFIDDDEIRRILESRAHPDRPQIEEVLAKARELKGLTPEEAAVLINCRDPELVQEVFATARWIKEEVYGNRIVLFAPLYLSSPCVNNCAYCGFRHTNDAVTKRTLSLEELEQEVRILISKGHKRLIVVYGEHPESDIDYMCRTIEKIYSIKKGRGEIRRVNVNAPPLTVEEYRRVKDVGIGTYQVFQETYHHATYRKMHPANTPKGSYRWRLFAQHRAQEAGIDDVAIGALFGLYDWRFEVLGLIIHARDLEREFGVGPHTISFPRLEPALNTPLTTNSPYLVSDEDFKKVIAVLRCAVPYTGMILTCRERPEFRREAIRLGISQVDAGSRIAVGGYAEMEREHIPDRQQFQLGDTRSLDEFIYELCQDGYIPSFCTSCYRAARTGCHFMSFAKKGLVKNFCIPNAALTFKEYLLDYASPQTRALGEEVIGHYLEWFNQKMPKRTPQLHKLLQQVEAGERDVKF
ncbi:[FeFe] hydrogenase H-cluster radical SAM maturase HydG [Desulforudis sp. 1088]|uniref:[FeFe] hydrogenase H-cluster radical SAM maturase HydG n=1 Tax=unclassified Candidatus Desulforudis TaxID=2635950 RepID=UPI003CE46455